jgi:hypothetical protein
MLVFVLMTSSTFAQSYCLDCLEPGNPGGVPSGLTTCDLANPMTISPGETFSVDVWASAIPEQIVTSGFELTYNSDAMRIISVEAYDGVDIDGPWDGTGTFKIPKPYGPGSYEMGVMNLSCVAPDAHGGIIIAKVTFQCLAAGTGNISVKGIDGFDTTVGCNSSFVYDAAMGTNKLTITQTAFSCTSNAQCDDGKYCNGTETCNSVTGKCRAGTAIVCDDGIPCTTDSCNEASDICDHIPNNAVCNDGADCNGAEECNPASGCVAGAPVNCPDDGLFCNGIESCDENTGACISSGNPCLPETHACVEATDECKLITIQPTLQLTPESWYQSRWLSLIKFFRIEGSNSHFDRSVTEVTFTPESAVIMLPMVMDESTINCIGILMPRWWAPVDSIDVTVTTGTEVATATMEIKLLPFLLEQDRSPLWEK